MLVVAGDMIPADGDVVLGLATVDESAITGESAPVIRESGGDFSAVTGGTRVLSDQLIIQVTQVAGQGFLDRMIALVEGAKRQKTPNEIALTILLVALTLVFLLVCASLLPFSSYAVHSSGQGEVVSLVVLVALLVCLIPTTIGGLLSAIGVAGMSRMMAANVVATSGRAIEAAGDIDVLLLDKTGTITYGNRQAHQLFAAPQVEMDVLVHAALWASLGDDTPEGRSIVDWIVAQHGMVIPQLNEQIQIIAFSAQTRMSGVDVAGKRYRKGAIDAMERAQGHALPAALKLQVDQIAKRGSTPLLVSENEQVLGVIELKDVVKTGIKARFAELRQMGIRTVMITGDNPLTAAASAAEAGVDDFMAQAAKEAANMVDLDSNPTKLIEVVKTGKQMLMTRGALTTFSLANDLAKYFAIIPAAFASTYPALNQLNIMQLSSPNSAILSAVIFNALIIVALIPLAMRGVRYQPTSAAQSLRRNLLIYGGGGLVLPFVAIKLIDLGLVATGLV